MSIRPIHLSELDVDMRDVEMPSWEVESFQHLDGKDAPLLLPTRTIFLSYSGFQKAFVEQLYWDLWNRGHTLFFDKSDDSLPRGKAFPKLIVEATRQCVVAVVVLSEQYLMSKWPMLELVAFVDAQSTCNPSLYLLPLYYKLNVDDLKDVQHLSRWKAEWQRLAAVDARVDPGKCEDALRILNRSNGVQFSEYGESEVRYRKAIMRDLFKLSRPYLKYCRPPMVGRSRLSQIIIGELERQSRVNSGRPAVLGLYGLGGMGKTLLCKALCSHFREQYAGRVCHVECSKSLGSLELQNLILDELTDANKSRLKTCEEALMSISLNLPREAVFLALDNVQEGDLQWLQSIFNGNHNPKSKFVVTSRCFSNVQSLVRDKDLCWAIPSLTDNEALELFVRSAVPTLRLKIPRSFSTDQQTLNILKACIMECFFSINEVQDCRRSQSSAVAQPGHYNPMLLQILGSSIKETKSSNPVNFIEKCRMWGKLQHFHKHPVFEILRTEYDALYPQRCKLLFLDVTLFAPREKLRKLDDLCAWLEGMHDCGREEILHNLRKLRRSSLIEDWETTAQSQILFHDLYKDFAAYELQQVEADKRWAVYHTSNQLCGLPQNLEGSPPGRNWPDLVRISLRVESQLPGPGPQPDLQVLQSIVLASSPVLFPSRKKIQQWENVQLLCLEGFESPVLDISPLKCLRSLKLVSYELRTLKGCDKLEQLRFVELNCSGLRDGLEFAKRSKLQELVTGEIFSLQSLRLPAGSSGSGLQVCKLHGWNKALPTTLDLSNHCLLREVAIAHSVWDSGRASLWGSWSLSLLGLRFLTKLVNLTLVKLQIGALPGLENLAALEFLNLRSCAKLEGLPDLRALLRLVQVDRHGCEKLPPDQPRVSRGCLVNR